MPRSNTPYVCAALLALALGLFLLADGQSLIEAEWAIWHRGWHATEPHDLGAVRFKLPERWVDEGRLSPPVAAGAPAVTHAVLGGSAFGDGSMGAMVDISIGPATGTPSVPAPSGGILPEVILTDVARNIVIRATSRPDVYDQEQLATIAREVLASVERREPAISNLFTKAKPVIAAREKVHAEAQRILGEWANQPLSPAHQWLVTQRGDLLQMLGPDLCQVMVFVTTLDAQQALHLEHRLINATLERKLEATQAALLFHEDGRWKIWHRGQVNETNEPAIQAWGVGRQHRATVVRFHLVNLSTADPTQLRTWLARARDPI